MDDAPSGLKVYEHELGIGEQLTPPLDPKPWLKSGPDLSKPIL